MFKTAAEVYDVYALALEKVGDEEHEGDRPFWKRHPVATGLGAVGLLAGGGLLARHTLRSRTGTSSLAAALPTPDIKVTVKPAIADPKERMQQVLERAKKMNATSAKTDAGLDKAIGDMSVSEVQAKLKDPNYVWEL